MTGRELVLRTLEFRNPGGPVPAQLWVLSWAQLYWPGELAAIEGRFRWDFDWPPLRYAAPPATSGNPFAVGRYVDEWGCTFTNIQPGVIGEIKDPVIGDEDWADAEAVRIPEELLDFDVAAVDAFCAQSDRFILCPGEVRPFERLQFLRGTENFYIDLMTRPPKMMDFIRRMHDFYCRYLKKWAATGVDGLYFLDDWGAQNALLINPALWEELFMPMYRDYIDIAHKNGKKAFMHSDGHILAILPQLVALGLDAVNAQLFCMGLENLAPFAGKLTFWGEMDRQNLLPNGTPRQVEAAVGRVYSTLWRDGGCIAQCEFGPGARPENVAMVFEAWSRLP